MLRRGLTGALLLLAVACIETSSPEVPGSVRGRVLLLATADIGGETEACACYPEHRGGLAARLSQLETQKQGFAGPALVVDAGDVFFRQTSVPLRNQKEALRAAEALADGMAESGAVAMAVGERDLAFGARALRRLAQRAQVRLLSANLVDEGTGRPVFDPYVVVDANSPKKGLKIGMVGASPVLDRRSRLGEVFRKERLVAKPLRPAVLAAAADARAAGAEWVVGLLHVGQQAARQLLASLPPGTIDLAIVGHDRVADGLRLVSGTTSGFVAAGERGRNLLAVDITVITGAQRIVEVGPTDLLPQTVAHRVGVEVLPVRPPSDGVGSSVVALPRVADGVSAASKNKRQYSGSRKCRSCHEGAYRHWQRTPHAGAWKTLERVRQSANLDCIPCHATGFGLPGGPRRLKHLKRFKAVGCESCHGPGRSHAEDPQQGKLRFGATVPERVCTDCHRAQADQEPFDYRERIGRVVGKGHRASTDGRGPATGNSRL